MNQMLKALRFSGSQITSFLWMMIGCHIIGKLILIFLYPQEEWLGFLTFGGLIISFLINIFVSFSQFFLNGREKIGKIIWVVFFLYEAILGGWVIDYQGMDSGIPLVYCMLILTFPMGLLWAGFLSAMSYVLQNSSWEIDFAIAGVVVKLGFFFIGYFQWFIFWPYIIKKLENLRGFFNQLEIK